MGGDDYERELVNTLSELGYRAFRAPASGGARDAELPDIIAGKCAALNRLSDCLAIELKTTSSTTAYATEGEVRDLRSFSEGFGATEFLAAKFKRPGGVRNPYYLVEPEFCRRTDSGNFGIPESDAESRAKYLIFPSTGNKEAELREVGR